MLPDCLILLHIKRNDKAIIPRIIQFGSCLQIFSERIKIVGIKQAFTEAKHYNVNHTALVYHENGVYKVFQANATNNVHTLLLSDYLANTNAQIYASIHYDAEYTNVQKINLLKLIDFYSNNIKYNIVLAFLAWRPARRLLLEDRANIINLFKADDKRMLGFKRFISKNPISFQIAFHRYKASPLFINYNLKPIDLSHQDFSNLNFKNMELSGVMLNSSNDCIDGDNHTCNFTGCNFTGCNFTNASIAGNFTDCNFTDCNFTEARIGGNFTNVLLDNATFINCDASLCKFTNAKGSYANFAGANLFDSNFAQSKLTNCIFDKTYIECVSFENADLTHSTFIQSRDYDPDDYGSLTYCEETTFKNAIVNLDGVDFYDSDTIMPDGRCWRDWDKTIVN